MLISFSIRNYRSLRDEQVLDLSVGDSGGLHPGNLVSLGRSGAQRLLRSVGIWGANASGKSNVLYALGELLRFVTTSHLAELDSPIGCYHPFLLEEGPASAPVEFELEFWGRDSLRYIYSVSLERSRVVFESLVFYPGPKSARLFERRGDEFSFGSRLTGTRQIPCRCNQSYLGVSAQHPQSSDQLKEVYRYLRDDFHVVAPGRGLGNREFLVESHYREALSRILAFADTGITRVECDEARLPIFFHGAEGSPFRLEDESAGTRRLYELAPMLVCGLARPGIWVVDELDCQLHPRVAEMILRLFHDPRANRGNAQLVFATHNTSLMDSDLLRRDQVWFTQKDQSSATSLICLDEYAGVRENTDFEKWYRQGRFEAVPEIRYNALLEFLEGTRQEEDNA